MIANRIIYEDNHLLVVNKLPGEIVQSDKTGDLSMIDDLKNYLREKYNKPGNIYLTAVHRIDRPVSGAIIFAKTSKAAARMSKIIQSRDFHKYYLALTCAKPHPLSGNIKNYLLKNEKQNKSYIVDKSVKNAQEAELNYQYVKSTERYHLIEVELLTGRHHQIRVQLASVGAIIKGDLKYGAARSNPDGSICLHAHKLIFAHPVKDEEMTIIAPLPESMSKLIDSD
ncbi:RluA family pseudouridine synthase [Odoribacter sp. OttesenSCG-928-L07]|nr:RluA family pseudouridine synthase [Odoribacter sp. OttesenSCG-928-L07]MDL2238954.1 RluA family pseudouridine synthase [Bacteroidales bacterium OttesenSCG-928-L14]